jgi:hypothetical protein
VAAAVGSNLVRYAQAVFFSALPFVAWLQVQGYYPTLSWLYYGVWGASFLLYARRVLHSTSGSSHQNTLTLVVLLLIALSIGMMFIDSVPTGVLDNLPSAPDTVAISSSILLHGSVPQSSPASQYVHYPLSMILLSVMELAVGTSSDMVPKLLAVAFILIPPMILYGCMRDKRVGLTGATVLGFSPWFFVAGVHYSPEAEGGVLFAATLSMLVSMLIQSNNRFIVPVSLMAMALALTDVFYGFVWVVLLITLSASIILLRRWPTEGRHLLLPLGVSAVAWASWYILGTGALLVAAPLAQAFHVFFEQISLNSVYLVSSQSIPLWIRVFEYATYFSLGACAILVVLVNVKKRPLVTALVAVTVLVAVVVILPFVRGYQGGTDLAERSYLIFQVGVAVPIALLLSSASRSRRTILVAATILVVCLVPANALLYGGRPYQFSPSFAYSSTDSRFNLESWDTLGGVVCQYSSANAMWGVRLGAAYVTCMTYFTISPYTDEPNGLVSAKQLTGLQQVVGSGELVALRFSLQGVPEWPQPLPQSPDKIVAGYDVVFDFGDPVLLYTAA